MRDRIWILLGLLAGLGLLTFPIWYDNAAGTSSAAPEIKKAVKGNDCIYPVEFMRANHMNVLMKWRDEVVRRNVRTTTIGGKTWEMSLTGTCMDCHVSTEDFCTACHQFAGVDPPCWNCHVEPENAVLAKVKR